MPKHIEIRENGLLVDIIVTDEGTVRLANFSLAEEPAPALEGESLQYSSLVEIKCTGEGYIHNHGQKHILTHTGHTAVYAGHRISRNACGAKAEFDLSAENGLFITCHFQFFDGIPIVRSWTQVQNRGTEDIGLEYVSSFLCHGLCRAGKQSFCEKAAIYTPYTGWYNEFQWKKQNAEDLGLTRLPLSGYHSSGTGLNRYFYGSDTAWSSGEFLPMGILDDEETCQMYFWQIENSSGWLAEYGQESRGNLYLALSGPCETMGNWWKNLRPGEEFTTATAAFGMVKGDLSDTIAALTKYRRAIRRKNSDDENCTVIFNDYMNCLNGDPTEENEIPIIEIAASLGCEYYCIDAGWYDDGPWWNRVGEWKESSRRFPSGLKKTIDFIRSKGMVPGLWVEIESIGTESPIAAKLPDSWFFCRHGKRHCDRGRYLLDFRNPEVRQYATDTLDRLIRDYGVGYFKIDYNVTPGIGTDVNSDSCGDGLLEHIRALYGWHREMLDRHPGLILENCGSGGQRMDYGILQTLSLQSITDQTDFRYNARIAAAAATAVAPEQAGCWVYPYEDSRGHILCNMVGGILLRPYISGQVWNLPQESLDLLREGISVYKSIRHEVKDGLPFFPLGLPNITEDDGIFVYGLHCPSCDYLAVTSLEETFFHLVFDYPVDSISCIYPSNSGCTVSTDNDDDGCRLEIELPEAPFAVLLKIIRT